MADRPARVYGVCYCAHVLDKHRGKVFSVAFSGDGRMLASIGTGGEIHIWNPKTG